MQHIPPSPPITQGKTPPFSSETLLPGPVHRGLPLCNGPIASLPGIFPEPDHNACSWDPGVFRQAVVSCYSGQIFSEEHYRIPVSQKPGIGFVKPGCGEWVRTIKSGDEFRKIFHNCDTLGCPVCMPGALTQKGRDVEDRFDKYEQAKKAENAVLIPGEIRGIKPRQFIFTMTPAHQAALIGKVIRNAGKRDPGAFLELAREEYMQAIKISGLIGGITVYHDARLQHPDTGSTGKRAKHLIIMEAKIAGNMTDEDPAWKIYDHIRQQEKPLNYYRFSPHFHAIAYGMAIPVAEFEELMPGWTYHNKGNVTNPGGLARYLFSHMAIIEDKKSVSWFGRLSSRNLGKEELRTYEKVEVHPVTGLPWIIVASTIPGEIGGTYRTTITDYRSFFRVKFKKPVLPLWLPWFTPEQWDKNLKKTMIKTAPSPRPKTPPGIHEKGILALSKFVDEFGRL
jgi:hypothetical protein